MYTLQWMQVSYLFMPQKYISSKQKTLKEHDMEKDIWVN